ncbi:hypothetical protein Gasu2_00960 [Galdieria sulphuraria]|uniref:F-box domain-containing protein n=1 Tax=Galdieria sulphuraria TaxID=130081 RepID=M2XTU5_GALSU|nr:uncharacterized protein Gasu_53040 [Galdieria sulphuraria]EME27083.1 hypothetical protein Gasu_53040 [Galdieria sulphuraria]GJD05638.1 hypothetical protein Gasu2_00960 [Galdieria sulphuraria]|eukprot:XP_005703603.1 hypothetical protein Gasu_53040 [Galdieria sulphuraria]
MGWKPCRPYRKKENNLPVLPEDIESQILELLEFVQDVAVARMVCKRWKRLVDENSQLWRRLKGLTLPKRLPSEAEKWYRKAAQCGNREALALLALLYYYGYQSQDRTTVFSLPYIGNSVAC